MGVVKMAASVLRMRAMGAMQASSLGSSRVVSVLTATGGGRDRDGDDFLTLVTGSTLDLRSLAAGSKVSAEQLTAKCGSAPQLVSHLSKMRMEPLEAAPVLTGVSLLTNFEPEPSLHWPRRGGL